jgi:Bacterial Ig-like domain (group 3)
MRVLPNFSITARFVSRLVVLFIFFLAGGSVANAQWVRIGGGNGNAGSAPGNGPAAAGTCVLLTDGSVMCHEVTDPLPQGAVDGTHWWRLTPDNKGHYETGTWSKLTNSPATYGPLFYCSAVLADGRVAIIGGEYNLIASNSSPAAETTLGYVFDPTQNSGAGNWSAVSLGTTGFTQIGDSVCTVQPDKTFIMGVNNIAQMATLNLGTLTLSLVHSPTLENSKADNNSEEGWTLLPDGTVLAVDTGSQGGTGAEIYSPSTQKWAPTGGTIVSLVNNGGQNIVPEMGPQILRPDGTVVAFGANPPFTSVYTPTTKTWAAGPQFPVAGQSVSDGPASLMPSGNVLVGAGSGFFVKPTNYFEFDGTLLNPVTGPPNAANDPTFVTTMLLLPTGQVLFTDLTGDVELYTSTLAPPNTFKPAWRPTIIAAPTNIGTGTTYPIFGTQFNGLSQASAYGDDATMATNYPLVTITNTGTGHVFYSRTHDHSTMGVATGSATVSTNFDVPSGIETGPGTLVVIADGIPSAPLSVNVAPGTTLTYTGATSGPYNHPVTLSAVLKIGGSPISGATVTFTTTFESIGCSASTNGSGVASCSVTPSVPAGNYSGTASFAGNSTQGASFANFNFTVTREASTLTITGPVSADYSDAVTVEAKLTDSNGGAAIAGRSVTFVLGSGAGTETCTASTNSSGNVTCSITPNQVPGPYPLTASFAGDTFYLGSSDTVAFTIKKEDTAVAFTVTSAVTSDYHDAATVQAQLTDPTGGAPIAGKSLTFVLGSGTGTETCVTGPTDASGNASCSITPNQAAGPYTLTSSFSGDAFYLSSSTNVPFTITREEDTLAFTASSPTVIANSHPVTFSATLLEDGTTPPVPFGQTVTITLGSGITAQSCTGTTNSTGLATCTISSVNQPLGPNTVFANFAGDGFYLPSSTSEPVIDFAFLARGSMIIGDLDSASGTPVEFWGAPWSTVNSLSGGPAPDSFKGFADNSLQSCGGSWSTRPGNSSAPPAVLPSYMGVIASSAAAQSGSTISGTGPIIVVVKTDPGYSTDPGHPGTGTVVAVYCHP